jgi:hypothetical protein
VIKKEISNMKASIDRIMENMKRNNLKLCYFIIDTVRTFVPNVKFSEEKINIIKNSFEQHQLGKIESNHLNHYYRGSKLLEEDEEDTNDYYRARNNAS